MRFFGKKATRFRVQLGMDIKRCSSCRNFTRPCEVYGEPAVFHRWCEIETAILRFDMHFKPEDQQRLRCKYEQTHTIPPGCSLEKLTDIVALVEWPAGTVSKVSPDSIKFLDTQHPNSRNELKETKS